jgi:hypothetical protein
LQKVIVILLILVVFSEGCSVLRKSEKANLKPVERSENSELAGSIGENNISAGNFFIRKAEITVTTSKGMDRFTASVRFRKPDSVLINVRSKIGIEVARALLTKDTVLLNDKVNKKLMAGNTRQLEKKYGVNPSVLFALFGDFIIGEKDQKRLIKCQNGFYRDSFIINDRKVDYTVDCKRRKITGAYFEGSLTTGNINLIYRNFKNMDGILVPREIDLTEDLSEITINVIIDNVEIGWREKLSSFPAAGMK